MYYIVYQTTNLINGKIYIGQHQTSDLTDGYLGSGKHLQRAIKKYGIENFKREILYQFDNPEDMASKEAELVTEEFCKRDDTYNICPGGKGGFGYINSIITSEQRRQYYYSLSDEVRKKISFLTGKRKTEIALNKRIEKSKKPPHPRIKFDYMWITNGEDAQRIKTIDNIPEGWVLGRKFKNKKCDQCETIHTRKSKFCCNECRLISIKNKFKGHSLESLIKISTTLKGKMMWINDGKDK